MTMLAQLPAFACGIGAVLLSYTFFANVHAQPGGGEVIVACADGEGRMRMKEPAAACAPGETLVPLKPIELKRDDKTLADPSVADLERRLRELESALSDKSKMLDRKVEAPFEVVNEAGTRVFSVEEESLGGRAVRVFNDAGKEVGWIAVYDSGGFVRLMSTTSQLIAQLEPEDFHVRDRELERHRVDLGAIEGTRHGLRLYNAEAKMIAGIGQSEVESGVAIIADEVGRPRFRMLMGTTAANVGKVEIVNTEGVDVASLTVDERQNGLLQLRNGEGRTMVEAGTIERVGAVRAGPGAFQHGIMFLGLPGSYIQGKPK